jgi:aspartate/methionine/tyrosine aminotransferase
MSAKGFVPNETLNALPTTIFEKMSTLAREYNSVNLGQGFPDATLSGPDSMISVVYNAMLTGSNQYPPMFGIPELRAAIATHSQQHAGVSVTPENVLITVGATEALAAAFLGLLNPGDQVVVFQPIYDSYIPMIRRAGAIPVIVDLQPPHWNWDSSKLAAAFTSKTKMVVLNTPHNPTGKVFSSDELDELASLCIKNNTIALLDEVYQHLVHPGYHHISMATIDGMSERSLRIGSAGKTFSFTDWKVGWIAGPHTLVAAVAQAHQFLTFTVNSSLQKGVHHGLVHCSSFYLHLGTMLAEKRSFLSTRLEKLGFTVLPAQGTYFLIADFSRVLPDYIANDDVDFAEELTKHGGVTVIPVSAFYSDDGDAAPPSTLVRFVLCKEDEKLDKACTLIEEYLKKKKDGVTSNGCSAAAEGQQQQPSSGDGIPPSPSTSSSITSTRQALAARSDGLLKGPLSYIDAFITAQSDMWSLTDNPKGYIPLSIAENKLNNTPFLSQLAAVTTFPPSTMNYDNSKGCLPLMNAMGHIMSSTFLQGVDFNPQQHLTISSGCSAILDNLFYLLAESGSGVLIPAPYYPAFDNDLMAKNGVHPVPFYLDEEAGDIGGQLEKAYQDASVGRGIEIRAVLVTNPNNPLGIIYKDETVREMLDWTLNKHDNIHYVTDEIYALSVYKKQEGGAEKFTSGLKHAQEMVKQGVLKEHAVIDRVHLLYGLSKDWCGSGLRVGVLLSKNQRLNTAMNSIAIFVSVSNYAQHALAQVLMNDEWTAGYMASTRDKLENSYDTLTGCLDMYGIPYRSAVAGMFVWVDLRKWLKEDSWMGERELLERMQTECKVLMTPGEACHAESAGYFRICFAWMPAEALMEMVERLVRVFEQ